MQKDFIFIIKPILNIRLWILVSYNYMDQCSFMWKIMKYIIPR